MSRIFGAVCSERLCGAGYPRRHGSLGQCDGRRALVLYRPGQDRLLPPPRPGLRHGDERGARQFRRSADRADPAAQRRALDVQGVSRLRPRRAAAHVVLDQGLPGASTTARSRSATKWATKARSAASRAASPISIRRPIPAPWWRYPTSAAARGVSSSTSAGSPPVGTAPIRSAKSGDADRCAPSSSAPQYRAGNA